ncbi:MAG: cyclic nucleotide-binding domain-containing protein [Terriglobales bacterium]|jgi:CRP/FNR family transcriptional regulator
MLQSCLDCAQRSDRVFCDLPPDALQEFDGIKSLQDYPKGTVLFREGQPNRGIFLLCKGRVRISVCSEDGRRMNLRTASAGEVLGMSAALSGGLYEVTAEATEPLQVAVVRRKELLHFLRRHREVCLQVVNLLSEDLHVAYDRVRTLGLTHTRHTHPHNHSHTFQVH